MEILEYFFVCCLCNWIDDQDHSARQIPSRFIFRICNPRCLIPLGIVCNEKSTQRDREWILTFCTQCLRLFKTLWWSVAKCILHRCLMNDDAWINNLHRAQVIRRSVTSWKAWIMKCEKILPPASTIIPILLGSLIILIWVMFYIINQSNCAINDDLWKLRGCVYILLQGLRST